MTLWLERKEKVLRHQRYMEWRSGNEARTPLNQPSIAFSGILTLTKWPSRNAVDLDEIVHTYGATFFREALRRYLVLSRHSGPPLTSNQLERAISYITIGFTSVPVYYKLKFTKPADSVHTKNFTLDTIYARPKRRSKKGQVIPARFDTALVNTGLGGETSMDGMIISC
jgi:hypothetical protein